MKTNHVKKKKKTTELIESSGITNIYFPEKHQDYVFLGK